MNRNLGDQLCAGVFRITLLSEKFVEDGEIIERTLEVENTVTGEKRFGCFPISV